MKSKKLLLKNLSVILIAVFFILINNYNSSAQPAKPVKDDKEKKETAGKKDKSGSMLEDTGWRTKDYQPYIKSIKELEKLNREYSENVLKMAIDEYSTGLDILDDMENDVSKFLSSRVGKKHLNERFYWQEIDRKNQESRIISRKKYEAKMKAITYFTRSINHLDDIQNVELKREQKFINFQSGLFKVYVSTNYDLNNFKPCIPILERYLRLSKKNREDPWAYKYLTSCYGYMEKVLTKYKHATEDEIMTYRNKKNRSMLQAVKLTYGEDSPHFKLMQESVERDEKKSKRINDYK